MAEDVSVRGLAVLPGIIDAHVHLGQDITVPKTPDDARRETEAAAAGGVCTLIAYLMMADPYHEVLGDAVAVMETHGVSDFGFHFCIVPRDQLESTVEDAAATIARMPLTTILAIKAGMKRAWEMMGMRMHLQQSTDLVALCTGATDVRKYMASLGGKRPRQKAADHSATD